MHSNASTNQTTPASKVLNVQQSNKKGGQKGKSRKERRERTANVVGVATMAEKRMRGTLKILVK